jgi:exodeoxyribonuclease-3
MLKIASWNVNSLKVRLEQVLQWIESQQIDILGLQETKLVDEVFPSQAFRELGYEVIYSGQKTYNGVAVISRQAMTEVVKDIPDLEDVQRRILAVTIAGVRLINLYVPNGAAVGTDKYEYKLNWLSKVKAFIQQQLRLYPQVVVLGDFNIAPADLDVHSPEAWQGQVLVSPKEREAFFELIALGLNDSLRTLCKADQIFTWWDYRQGGFRRNHGLRIDHILLSQGLISRCVECQVDAEPRRSERPSDHAPIWCLIE